MNQRVRAEPDQRAFSELVREGCRMHGIGLPWPAYVFHAHEI